MALARSEQRRYHYDSDSLKSLGLGRIGRDRRTPTRKEVSPQQ